MIANAKIFAQLPREVMLRNRTYATILYRNGVSGFSLIGRYGLDVPAGNKIGENLEHLGREDRGHHHCWRLDGRWRETGVIHELDIVGIVTSRTGQTIEYIPYGPAAGEKGTA